jgi:hypothetical protein
MEETAGSSLLNKPPANADEDHERCASTRQQHTFRDHRVTADVAINMYGIDYADVEWVGALSL